MYELHIFKPNKKEKSIIDNADITTLKDAEFIAGWIKNIHSDYKIKIAKRKNKYSNAFYVGEF